MHIRWSLLVAAAVFLPLALLDFTSLPAPVRTQALALRLGLVRPALALAGFAADLPRTRIAHCAWHLPLLRGNGPFMKGARTRKKTRRDGNHRGALSEEQPCQRV